MYCAGVGIVEEFFTMTMPKPILVIALIMATVVVVFAVVIFRTIPAATPDRQAIQGNRKHQQTRGCRQNRCKNSGGRTQMRLSLSVWLPP